MNGVRIYIRHAMVSAATETFYSRKGGGPVYRWCLNEKSFAWNCSRLDSSQLTTREFFTASWKTLPESLQKRLAEHYLE